MARVLLDWYGPLHFTSGGGSPILSAPDAQGPGLYLWLVETSRGMLPHYVGETGKSIARRHYEHFREYAAGVYSVRAADAFAKGIEKILYSGPLWRKSGWRNAQAFIDAFPGFAREIAAMLDHVRVYVASLDQEQRVRRRVESAMVGIIDGLPDGDRVLWPRNLRKWRRRADEAPIEVVSTGEMPLGALRERFFA